MSRKLWILSRVSQSFYRNCILETFQLPSRNRDDRRAGSAWWHIDRLSVTLRRTRRIWSISDETHCQQRASPTRHCRFCRRSRDSDFSRIIFNAKKFLYFFLFSVIFAHARQHQQRSTAAVHIVRRVLNVYDAENRTFFDGKEERNSEKIKAKEREKENGFDYLIF